MTNRNCGTFNSSQCLPENLSGFSLTARIWTPLSVSSSFLNKTLMKRLSLNILNQRTGAESSPSEKKQKLAITTSLLYFTQPMGAPGVQLE